MSEQANAQPPAGGPSNNPQQAPPVKRKRRKWPWILGVLVLLILIPILLAPTILSTSAGRNFVLGQVNQALTGRVAIGDWSLGWTDGISLADLRVYEPDGSVCLAAKKVSTKLSLVKALFGTIELGPTRLEGGEFDFKVYADGTNNFARLIKNPSPPSKAPLRVPNLSFDLVADAKGSIRVEGQKPLDLPGIKVSASAANINGPIRHSVVIDARSADGQAGQITLAGDLQFFRNNRLDLTALQGQTDLKIANIPAATVTALRGPMPGIGQVGGVLNGQFALALTDGRKGTLAGEFHIAKLSAELPVTRSTPPVRPPEVYRSETLAITIPPVAIDAPDGLTRLETACLTVGQGQSPPITIIFDQGKLTAVADITLQSLLNAMDPRKPRQNGFVKTTTDIDVAKLAEQLPATLGVAPGVKITSAKYHQSGSLEVGKEKLTLTGNAALQDIRGTGPDGKPLVVPDISLAGSVDSLGGSDFFASLRDLKAKIASSFATASLAGENLTSIKGTADADLQKFQQDLGQLLDFSGLELAGKAHAEFTSTGDLLTAENGAAKLGATVTVAGLVIKGLHGLNPIAEPNLAADAGATLRRGRQTLIGAIEGASARLTTGDPAAPTVALDATTSIDASPRGYAIRDLAVSKLAVDLAKAQQQYGALLPTLAAGGTTFQKGSQLTGHLTGKLDQPSTLVITGEFVLQQLGIERQGQSLLREDSLPLAFDLVYNQAADALDIRQFSADAKTSGAVRLSAKGQIAKLKTRPTFANTRITLDDDVEKLLALLQPFVDLSSLKARGVAKGQVFTIDGPLTPFPSPELKVTGGLAIDSVEVANIKAEKVNPQFTLQNSVLTVGGKPVIVNGGTLRLEGCRIKLADTVPAYRLDLDKGKLLDHVQLTPGLADQLSLFSFIFQGATQASGTVDLEVVECADVPLQWLIPGPRPEKAPSAKPAVAKPFPGGQGRLVLTLEKSRMNSGPFAAIKDLNAKMKVIPGLQMSGGKQAALPGFDEPISISKAPIIIQKGLVNSTLDMIYADYKIPVSSQIDLPARWIDKGEMTLPQDFIKSLCGVSTVIPVAVSGPLDGPKYDFGDVTRKLVSPENVGNIIKDLTSPQATPKSPSDQTKPKDTPKPALPLPGGIKLPFPK